MAQLRKCGAGAWPAVGRRARKLWDLFRLDGMPVCSTGAWTAVSAIEQGSRAAARARSSGGAAAEVRTCPQMLQAEGCQLGSRRRRWCSSILAYSASWPASSGSKRGWRGGREQRGALPGDGGAARQLGAAMSRWQGRGAAGALLGGGACGGAPGDRQQSSAVRDQPLAVCLGGPRAWDAPAWSGLHEQHLNPAAPATPLCLAHGSLARS